MSENVIETIRATVQDILAPEIKSHGARLDGIDRRLDDMRQSLEHRLEHSKETLRAKMRAVESHMESRFSGLDGRLSVLENLIRGLIHQVSSDTVLRERVASLKARMPRQ